MEIRLDPAPAGDERQAVDAAARQAGLDLEPRDDAYGSAWRAAGLRDGLGREPGDGPGCGPEPSLL